MNVGKGYLIFRKALKHESRINTNCSEMVKGENQEAAAFIKVGVSEVKEKQRTSQKQNLNKTHKYYEERHHPFNYISR